MTDENKSVTIEEVKKRKRDLEERIVSALNKFHDDTGILPGDICIRRANAFGFQQYISEVKIVLTIGDTE